MTSIKNELASTNAALTSIDVKSLNLSALGLSEADIPLILEAGKELDNPNNLSVAEYGKNLSKQTAKYTDDLLDLVKNKDIDETGKQLNEIISVAQNLNANNLLDRTNKKGILGFLLSKVRNVKQGIQAEYNTTRQRIDTIVGEIEKTQGGLKERVNFLEKMHGAVQEEHHSLGVLIAAGQLKQAELQQEIQRLSENSVPDTVVSQQIFELNGIANNLEKRVHDLSLLQQSALQTLPMIRIIQSNNHMLIDKFYAIKNVTLPAWKNQISLALSLNEQKNNVELVNNIDDATNALLRRNAELLHSNSVQTAKANQRSVIDVETLEHVQNTLIKTVGDVLQIQKEGMKQREVATERLKALQRNFDSIALESVNKQ